MKDCSYISHDKQKTCKDFMIRAVLFNLFVIAKPLKHFHACNGTPTNKKLKNTRVTCKKTKWFIIRHFNKQAVITEVEKQEI